MTHTVVTSIEVYCNTMYYNAASSTFQNGHPNLVLSRHANRLPTNRVRESLDRRQLMTHTTRGVARYTGVHERQDATANLLPSRNCHSLKERSCAKHSSLLSAYVQTGDAA